jgi:hypothetical protein
MQKTFNLSLEDMPGEIWVPVNGFESHYLISSEGRLKALARTIPHNRYKGVMVNRVEHIMKPKVMNVTGYANYQLRKTDANGTPIQKVSTVHRFVAEHFIPNPFGKPQVNHKNGDKLDNRQVNLEWVTRNENAKHSHLVLGNPSTVGKRVWRSKLDGSEYTVFEAIYAGMRDILGEDVHSYKIRDKKWNIRRAIRKNGTAYGYRWGYVYDDESPQKTITALESMIQKLRGFIK